MDPARTIKQGRKYPNSRFVDEKYRMCVSMIRVLLNRNVGLKIPTVIEIMTKYYLSVFWTPCIADFLSAVYIRMPKI